MNNTNKFNILLVDHRPDNLGALEKVLDLPDLELIKVTSGDQALGLVLEKEINLVLLNVQMPGMDGFEVAEIMREHEKTKDVPIIFVTALSTDRELVFKGHEAGAVDYLFKPVDPHILRAKVRTFQNLQSKEAVIRDQFQEIEKYKQGLENEITDRNPAEETLVASEEHFRSMIENSCDTIYQTDINGYFTYINPAFEGLTEYRPEQLQGKRFVDLVPAASKETIESFYADQFTQRVSETTLEFPLCTKSGEEKWVSQTVTLLQDVKRGKREKREKRVNGFQAVLRDITERKLTEEALASANKRLKNVLSAATQFSIMATDPEGLFTTFNSGAELMLGYSAEEMIGKQTPAIIHLESEVTARGKALSQEFGYLVKGFDVFVEKARQGGHEEREWTYVRKDGVHLTVTLSVTAVRDGDNEITGFLGIARDITDRKRAEEELKAAKEDAEEMNEQLEEMVERSNQMAVQAQAASMAKSLFLANMSHEIRTPMNGVIGMTRLLLDTELTQEQRGYAERVLNSGGALLSLINDILDFSKIEAGKMELDNIDFDLRTTLEDVTDILAIKAQEKGLELACVIPHDVLAFMRGDPGRLRQILINLVGNAIKFTEKGEVAIRVTLEEEDETRATMRFSVSDTGIGIPRNRMKALFESFSQLDTSITRKFGGTGLGLTISKKLAELMGGSIGVESEQGQGTTFWFTAVLGKQTEEQEVNQAALGDVRDKRIMVVDDHATSRQMLREQLICLGCRAEVAANGREALEKLHQAVNNSDPFVVVIVDSLMPEMTGETLGQKIKEEPELKNTIMVMLASIGFRGDATQLEEIGFTGNLTKPVRRSVLHDCLAVATGTRTGPSPRRSRSTVIKHSLADDQKHGVRILVVDDDETNRLVAKGALKQLGLNSDGVEGGEEALEALEKAPYDLVLMDVQMPKMDGLAATRNIRDPRSAVRNHHVPIIAITAHAMKEDRERCLQAGMDDYVSKPIEPQALIEAIARHAPISIEQPDADPEKAIRPLSEKEVFDRITAMHRLGDNEDLLKKIIAVFVADLPKQLEELKQAVNRSDASLVRQKAHKIKGASSSIGARAIGETASELEKAGKSGNLAGTLPLFEELQQEVENLRAVLSESGLV